MRFSLVLATVGRTEEVKWFLEHLARQTYHDFELLVVDQNHNDHLVPILGPYKDNLSILHLRSALGLSRARNVGLKHVSGDIVAFPDDDCWYLPSLLECVARFFQKHPNIDGLTGRCVDRNGISLAGSWDANPGLVNPFNVWRRGSSISMFIRFTTIKQIGDFDEALGVGAGTSWGAGEETDYLLRALKWGFCFYYDPKLVIYHPKPVKCYDAKAVARARIYGAGIGRVLRKHKYPFWFVFYQWLRSAGGAFLSLPLGRLGKARYHLAALQGKFLGWIAKPRSRL